MAPHFVMDHPCQSEPFSLSFDSNDHGINKQPALLSPSPTMVRDCDGRMPNWKDDTGSSSNKVRVTEFSITGINGDGRNNLIGLV